MRALPGFPRPPFGPLFNFCWRGAGPTAAARLARRTAAKRGKTRRAGQREIAEAYEAQWDNGRGSHHPDYDPVRSGDRALSALLLAPSFGWPGRACTRGEAEGH